MSKNEQEQNKFYAAIAGNYSKIFPYKPIQVEFIKSHAGELKGKSVLDIGCATGDLVKNVAIEGARVTGIDLNSELLTIAEKNNSHPNARYLMVNMLHIGQEFDNAMYDVVNCFGNTIVHLHGLKEIQQLVKSVYAKLKPGGYFFLQLLNYDYIAKEKIEELPVIDTNNLKFVRKYKFDGDSQIVRFTTALYLKEENQEINNETSLFMVRRDQLQTLLEHAGFREIVCFADFKGAEFGGKHLPLVIKARK